MWADAQRDGRSAEYRWRLLRNYRNSIPCTTRQSLADARCWTAVQCRYQYIGERKTWTQSEFCTCQIPSGGKSPRKCLYGVPGYQPRRRPNIAQFGWPPVSDIAAVTKARRKTRWNLLWCPKLPNRSQPVVHRRSPYCGDTWRRYRWLTSFSDCRYMSYLRRLSPTKLCDGAQMTNFWRFLRPVFSASYVQHISDMHSKFALRPHHV